MSPSESSPSPLPADNAAPAEPAPAAPSPAEQLTRPSGLVTILHPAGITPYAAEGLPLTKPLFARVTYRPH